MSIVAYVQEAVERREMAKATKLDTTVWVIARNYVFPAGGVTHVGGDTCFPTKKLCQEYMAKHKYEPTYYYAKPMDIVREVI